AACLRVAVEADGGGGQCCDGRDEAHDGARKAAVDVPTGELGGRGDPHGGGSPLGAQDLYTYPEGAQRVEHEVRVAADEGVGDGGWPVGERCEDERAVSDGLGTGDGHRRGDGARCGGGGPGGV